MSFKLFQSKYLVLAVPRSTMDHDDLTKALSNCFSGGKINLCHPTTHHAIANVLKASDF